MPTFAVLGAGGGTGKACVETLLQQGCNVRAVLRNPDGLPKDCFAGADSSSGQLEMVKGDVTDAASLRGALTGCKGVIFAASGKGYWSAKGVDCQGVKNVADVSKEVGGVERVVLVSSCLVIPARRFHPIRILLNNIRWSLMDYKYKGEELLRKSGVPYTIVRPGGLTNDPPGQAQLVTNQGDTLSGRVARADVAAVCVAALTDPAARNVTLELVSKQQQQPAGPFPAEGGVAAAAAAAVPPLAEQLKGIFQGLKPDT